MKELQVIYHGLDAPFVLGSLAEDGQDVLFQYSAQALVRGLELSPIRLPLRTHAYPDRRAEYVKLHDVPGLIYDALPDAWGYRLMHQRMQARGIDPSQASTLDRLAFLGDNTMGALTYAPALVESLDTRDLNLLELAQEVHAGALQGLARAERLRPAEVWLRAQPECGDTGPRGPPLGC